MHHYGNHSGPTHPPQVWDFDARLYRVTKDIECLQWVYTMGLGERYARDHPKRDVEQNYDAQIGEDIFVLWVIKWYYKKVFIVEVVIN